ncbi:DUF5597 domain-containing protein [Acidicapsa dinghuensis]|uniref:DUF5597 domain-containing protein n=1 Tax=Acidicapsa dinghuensis TaxID=2218256 RepID=A0ABW1EHI1_9BACT|nr:DUF5597 domain-containing protein [Acidicapsa dinghuensis]
MPTSASYLRRILAASLLFACLATFPIRAEEPPKFIQKDGRYAFLVDGKPFLMLGGQIHNSSAWPSELPQVFQSMADLHANTLEAPVYWEQFEPTQGHFDFTNVDALVNGAREHHLRLIILWFGTWKNGQMHYAPEWIKTDTKRYPRMIRNDGVPTDVLSANSRNNLEADKTAFVTLMRHLKEIDSEAHTVITVQVENESGGIGTIRDYSPEANAEFAKPVPADFLAITHKQPGTASGGTWLQVFPGDADEIFQMYHQAKYINEIAAAGRAEFNIPLYANVWVDYPPAELPERRLDQPGVGYPSGGPVQKYVGYWRALAPSLDLIGPDIYSDDPGFVTDLMRIYSRPDNALWIPEIGRSDNYAKYLFLALGHGALGFSPFGVDQTGWNITGDEAPKADAANFALLGPMSREIAQWNFEGKLKTSVEEHGQAEQEIDFGPWQASINYGFPQNDGRHAPGNRDAHGTALIAQLGPDEFIVTGIDCSVSFHLPGKLAGQRMQILSAEQGYYENGTWHKLRLWNGDETDRGLQFHAKEPSVVRVHLGQF